MTTDPFELEVAKSRALEYLKTLPKVYLYRAGSETYISPDEKDERFVSWEDKYSPWAERTIEKIKKAKTIEKVQKALDEIPIEQEVDREALAAEQEKERQQALKRQQEREALERHIEDFNQKQYEQAVKELRAHGANADADAVTIFLGAESEYAFGEDNDYSERENLLILGGYLIDHAMKRPDGEKIIAAIAARIRVPEEKLIQACQDAIRHRLEKEQQRRKEEEQARKRQEQLKQQVAEFGVRFAESMARVLTMPRAFLVFGAKTKDAIEFKISHYPVYEFAYFKPGTTVAAIIEEYKRLSWEEINAVKENKDFQKGIDLLRQAIQKANQEYQEYLERKKKEERQRVFTVSDHIKYLFENTEPDFSQIGKYDNIFTFYKDIIDITDRIHRVGYNLARRNRKQQFFSASDIRGLIERIEKAIPFWKALIARDQNPETQEKVNMRIKELLRSTERFVLYRKDK